MGMFFRNPNEQQQSSPGMNSMLSPQMGGGDKSNFDSSPMNYNSGESGSLFGGGARTGQVEKGGVTGGQVGPVQPNQTDGTLLGTSGSKTWGDGGNAVQAYYDSRGVAPKDTSAKYWSDQFNDWGKKDVPFFEKFLSNAEEFTGSPEATAQAMGWGGNSQSQNGQMQNGDSGMMSQIMPLLQQMMSQMGQQRQPQQQVSNGSMFANTPQTTMDMSSFL